MKLMKRKYLNFLTDESSKNYLSWKNKNLSVSFSHRLSCFETKIIQAYCIAFIINPSYFFTWAHHMYFMLNNEKEVSAFFYYTLTTPLVKAFAP